MLEKRPFNGISPCLVMTWLKMHPPKTRSGAKTEIESIDSLVEPLLRIVVAPPT